MADVLAPGPGSGPPGRLWLDVPFDENGEAKQLGA